MVIEIREVILEYPASFFLQKELEIGYANLIRGYGVGAYVNYQTGILIAYATVSGCRLEKVFPPEAVEKLTKKEVKVKLIYCPAGTKAVAVVFPQKEWIDRDPQILRGFYCARGYKAKIFPEARRLVLESGTADLNELPFKRFEQQGCTIEFIV